MLNDELYKRNNQNHHLMSKQIIGEFAHRFKWHPDGSDSLLDIGCGPGDVTNDVILPLLPEQFNRIVCSDISERMIGAARTTVRNPKAAFEVLDIGIPLEESNSTWATPFDHVTSFFCLHWVQDQRQALLNIFKLLVPGGNCLLTFVGGYSGFTVFAKMAQLPRWAPYMQNLQQFTPPTQYSSDIAGDIKSYMQEVGFSEYDVEVRDEKWEFDGIDNFKSLYRAIIPFLQRFPPEEVDVFLDEFVVEMKNVHSNEAVSNPVLIAPYKLVVVFGRK